MVVEAGGETAIGIDRFDRGHVAVGNAEGFIGRGELDAVAYGELTVDLAVDADAGEAAWIVGGKFSVGFLDSQLVCGRVDRYDRCVLGSFESDSFAATCVTNHVAHLVPACPDRSAPVMSWR